MFAANEELQGAIATWIERGKSGTLLDLWVKGLSVDWNGLYGAAKPRRISLPTYPFARERCWVERAADEVPLKRVGDVIEVASTPAMSAKSQTQVEDYVTQYFSDKLKLPRAAIKPDIELSSYGLDSIGAMGFRQACEAAFGIKITAREMLSCETITAVTAHIIENMPGIENPVDAGSRPEAHQYNDTATKSVRPARSSTSEGQKGLWALYKLSPGMSAYNLPLCFRIRRPPNVEALKEACRLIVKRHHVLSDAIVEEAGVPSWSAERWTRRFFIKRIFLASPKTVCCRT